MISSGITSTIVFVEGRSDQIALETLADRRGRDLIAEGTSIVPIGGAQAIGRFLAQFGPDGAGLKVAGLCDAGEEGVFRRGLERAGLGDQLTREGMERLGFFVCVDDLEDELIRAVGAARVEAVLEAEGDLGAFRTFQKQPAWRGQRVEGQLRRFMGSADSRKLRYARRRRAVELARAPQPLERVLAHVGISRWLIGDCRRCAACSLQPRRRELPINHLHLSSGVPRRPARRLRVDHARPRADGARTPRFRTERPRRLRAQPSKCLALRAGRSRPPAPPSGSGGDLRGARRHLSMYLGEPPKRRTLPRRTRSR